MEQFKYVNILFQPQLFNSNRNLVSKFTCTVNVRYVFDLEDLVQKSVTFSLIFLRFIEVELNKTVKMYIIMM